MDAEYIIIKDVYLCAAPYIIHNYITLRAEIKRKTAIAYRNLKNGDFIMGKVSENKRKYDVEIAGIQLSILSDESEEFVKDLVKKLDAQITKLTVHNKRCAKIDAAVLIALDALGEKTKLEKKLKNLEAQIALYEADFRRRRSAAEGGTDKAEESPKSVKQPLAQLSMEEALPGEKKDASDATTESKQESKTDKLRQIESFLRTMKDGN